MDDCTKQDILIANIMTFKLTMKDFSTYMLLFG